MTTADRKLIETKLRRRHYVQPAVDPIKDAMVISEKVQRSGCFGAAISLLAIAAVVVGVLS